MPRRDPIVNKEAVAFALRCRNGRATIRDLAKDLWEGLDPQSKKRYGSVDGIYRRISSILSENQGVAFARIEKGVWELMGERLV